MIIYSYELAPKPGHDRALLQALTVVRGRLSTDPCFRDAVIMQDLEDRSRYRFVERWDTVEAHDAATSALPPDFLAAIIASLAEPPIRRRLEVI